MSSTEFRPEMMRTCVLSNPHSLNQYRVNNALRNMPEFAKAFGCKQGQPLVHGEGLPGIVEKCAALGFGPRIDFWGDRRAKIKRGWARVICFCVGGAGALP